MPHATAVGLDAFVNFVHSRSLLFGQHGFGVPFGFD